MRSPYFLGVFLREVFFTRRGRLLMFLVPSSVSWRTFGGFPLDPHSFFFLDRRALRARYSSALSLLLQVFLLDLTPFDGVLLTTQICSGRLPLFWSFIVASEVFPPVVCRWIGRIVPFLF